MLSVINKESLVRKMAESSPSVSASLLQAQAEYLISTVDSRLEPNVLEWLEGRPLSDIRIGKYTLDMVIQIQGKNDFVCALMALSSYADNPTIGENVIWRTRS